MKPFKKRTKSTKAVAPIIANIILLTIIVILMSTVWGFVLAYTAEYQRGQKGETGAGGAILERMLIEDVRFYKRGENYDAVNITVYNYGVLDINLSAIAIKEWFCSDYTMYDREGLNVVSQIDQGGTCRLNVILNSHLVPWVEGTVYIIELITKRGYSVVGSYAAPVT